MLETRVDVLIVGAGPAGLMCANALAMVGVDVRIIDKRPTKVATGHADGIQTRTIEVFNSYGLAERLVREGNQTHMLAFYKPGPDGRIQCARRMRATPAVGTRYPFAIMLHQGAIEEIFLGSMSEHGVHVERPKEPAAMEISQDLDELSGPSSYPVKVTIKCLDMIEEENRTEIVHAKFVVGADGAHSWVRKALGIQMEGEQTDCTWAAVDMVPETNFPDTRNLTTVHSVNGTCKIVPREADKVRLYIQLSGTDAVDPVTGRIDKKQMNPEKLLSICRGMLRPFELANPKEIDWWTIYTIGQRVASSYSMKDRVFIIGDACHTHSPKAGQGMNAGINDAHNFAWKLAQVLRGWSDPSLLKTYQHERRKYAQDLIDFDKEFATLYSTKPRTAENGNGIHHDHFLRVYQEFLPFTSGIGIHYSPSVIVDPKHQKSAEKLVIGQRMLPQIYVRAADTYPMDIQDLLPSDLRFKMLFFVGYLTEARVGELNVLADELNKPSSFLQKYNQDGSIATVFDIITIAAGTKEDINYLLVPAFFRPHWTKVLLDDTDVTGRRGGDGYENYGIDPKEITLVIVRPDGYVGTIAPSIAIADLDSYFGSFLVARGLDCQFERNGTRDLW